MKIIFNLDSDRSLFGQILAILLRSAVREHGAAEAKRIIAQLPDRDLTVKEFLLKLLEEDHPVAKADELLGLPNGVHLFCTRSHGLSKKEQTDQMPVQLRPTPSLSVVPPTPSPQPTAAISFAPGVLLPMEKYEEAIFRHSLTVCEGVVSRVAEILGIGRATVYRKMLLYGITRPE